MKVLCSEYVPTPSLYPVNGIRPEGRIKSIGPYFVPLKRTVMRMPYEYALSIALPARTIGAKSVSDEAAAQ